MAKAHANQRNLSEHQETENAPPKFLSSAKAGLLAAFLVCVSISVWRFWPWMPEVFFGDDLTNLLAYRDGQFASNLSQALFGEYLEKYRPIFASVLGGLFWLFDDRLEAYMAVNVLVHGIVGALMYGITLRLSKGNVLTALIIALIATASRFALYQVTQVTGILEGIALIFFLVAVYGVVRILTQGGADAYRWGAIAAFAAFLATQTHERYVVLNAWLALTFAVFAYLRLIKYRQAVILAAASLAGAIFNIAYKTFALGSAFFVGTGGSHISLDISRTLTHSAYAVATLLGFNAGPAYLVAEPFSQYHTRVEWYLSIMYCGLLLFLLCYGWFRSWRTHQQFKLESPSLLWPVLSLALLLLLLAPPILTIRLEQRWLLAPLLLVLLLVAQASSHIGKKLAATTLTIFAASSLWLDSLIASRFDNIFFVYSANFAKLVKRETVDQHLDPKYSLNFFTSNDHCQWTLRHGGFFRVYGDRARTIACVDQTIFSAPPPSTGESRFFIASSGRLKDVTPIVASRIQTAKPVEFDFIQRYSDGTINDRSKVDTPTGQGALLAKWPSLFGPIEALTIISGFSYTYPGIQVNPGGTLNFQISMIFPTTSPARAIVRIKESGSDAEHIIFDSILPVRSNPQEIEFRPVSLPLDQFAGKIVSIAFSVETPGEDSSGHWIGFATPYLLNATDGTEQSSRDSSSIEAHGASSLKFAGSPPTPAIQKSAR